MKVSKVKLKLFLCVKYHAVNVRGRVDVQLCVVLTLALDGGQWSMVRFIPKSFISSIH
jgi:hypothetical protein